MNRTNGTLVFGLAMLMVGVVGANEAQADHCPSGPYLGKCDHAKLLVTVDVINATLYPTQNGHLLEIYLDVTPGSEPHDHISFGEIITNDGRFFSEVCMQGVDGKHKLHELNKRS